MKYTIGLGVGTTSVGWAVINNTAERIESTGVRHFESAENPVKGESLAAPRRLARSLRRRLDRRGYRLSNLKNIFIENKLMKHEDIEAVLALPNNPHLLRVQGLDHALSGMDLFVAIYHLSKRRGYKSNRKKVVEGEPKEGQQVLSNILKNKNLISEKGYRSVAESLVKECYDFELNRFVMPVRNKGGSYSMVVSREMLLNELKLILDCQVRHNVVTQICADNLFKSVEYQRHYASGNQIAKMVGTCTLNPVTGELRASKSTPSFQLFNALQKLNHMRVIDSDSNTETSLSLEQVSRIISESQERKDTTYKAVRKSLGLADSQKFKGVLYRDGKDVESEKCFSFSTMYELKKNIGAVSLGFWDQVKSNRDVLDQIVQVLTLYKTDEDISKNLRAVTSVSVPEIIIGGTEDSSTGLVALSYSKFGHLSLQTLYRILPYLEQGMTYDKACAEAGIDHRGRRSEASTKGLLPALSQDDHTVNNPVVRRSVSQTIKVVNALVRKYGKPTSIHLEFARDMAKSFEDRKTIEKSQKENQEKNTAAVAKIREFILQPSGQDIVKFKLWNEQGGKCLYSGKTIDETRLFEDKYCEVDHIIPFSRSFDDSYTNKVLVFSEENQNKGNRLPHEYFGSNTERWESYEVLVNALNIAPRKKRNLLTKTFKLDSLTARTLNDTRYIAKYLRNYIYDYMEFAEDSEKSQRVVTVGGTVTAYLRKRWGLEKRRDESLRHHAQDAVVVACAGMNFVHQVARFAKTRELQYYLMAQKDIIDPETGLELAPEFKTQAREFIQRHENKTKFSFPVPWQGFRDELLMWLSHELDSVEDLAAHYCEVTGKTDVPRDFKPLFVSKMPVRKTTGQVHDQTLRGPKLLSEGVSYTKKKIELVDLKTLEKMKGRLSDSATYEVIKERLLEYGDNPKKAFAAPIYKPSKLGQGNIIRSITVLDDQKSGILLNNGQTVARNDSMIRVDIFSKPNKRGKKEYYICPIYAYHRAQKELPCKLIVRGLHEKDWIIIDDSYQFKFSLQKNDIVDLIKTESNILGYYIGCNRSNASIHLISHDNSKVLSGNGIKTLDGIEKYTVDILGNFYRVKTETRQLFK